MKRVADEVLDDLWRRLDATRWPDDGPGGFALSDARELAAYWRDGYDWRAAEDELLGFSNVDVDGLHAIVEGDGPPLLLLHGWPSTVWEFHRVIPALREHFRLVVPSLPGYGWSGGRAGTADMGDAFHRLMGSLGHEQYLVAGGDWGAHIGCHMGHTYPDAVRALHLNMLPIRQPGLVPGLGGAGARGAGRVDEGRGRLHRDPGHEAADARLRALRLAGRADELDRREVRLLDGHARRPARRRADDGDDLLGHGDDRHVVLAVPRTDARRLHARPA